MGEQVKKQRKCVILYSDSIHSRKIHTMSGKKGEVQVEVMMVQRKEVFREMKWGGDSSEEILASNVYLKQKKIDVQMKRLGVSRSKFKNDVRHVKTTISTSTKCREIITEAWKSVIVETFDVGHVMLDY